MRKSYSIAWVISVSTSIGLLGLGAAYSQDYPAKPIRIITAEAGGGADITSRLIAQGISTRLGQPVVVDNRGGSAVIAIDMAAKAAPDGHVLLIFSSGMWTLPLIQNVSYDPLRDFSPITSVVNSPNVLVVQPSYPAKSLGQLIALAKAEPGKINYASGPTGSSIHLASELFRIMANVDIVRITYKGSGPALNDLIGGNVQMMFPAAGSVTPHITAGRLRALAVTTAQPSALLPGVPTVAAAGVPDYESGAMYGMFAPAKTPEKIVNRVNQEVIRALSNDDIKARFAAMGSEPAGRTPAAFTVTIKSEMAKWGKVIKTAGIREE